MVDLALLRDLAVIWLAALLGGYVCARLKQPTIAGYLVIGVFIGPHGLKFIDHTDQVKALAEFGAALLLFALGVEVYLKDIFASARIVLAGACQVLLTIAGAWAIAAWCGLVNTNASGFLFGCVCALSSTAVVTKVLLDRGESDTDHARLVVPMLIAQDLAIVPMAALIPILKNGPSDVVPMLLAAALPILRIAVVYLGATRIAPKLMAQVVQTESRELCVLAAMSLCLGTALVTEHFGMSLALGAFLGGIMISEFPHREQIVADLHSMRDLFSTVFFVSVGMLLNPLFVAEHWVQVMLFVVLLITGKTIIATGSARLATRSTGTALKAGVSLAQMGEFSFVLATLGFQNGIISDAIYNLFFSGAVVTIIVAPALMSFRPGLLAGWSPISPRREALCNLDITK